jgi:dephospho-CoA kinase
MRVYALVGGIAAGKSTVARRLARRHGGTWLDADRVGHAVLRSLRLRRELLRRFGADIVGPAGEIDRRRLGTRVFGRPTRLRTLNALVHPEIARRVRTRIAALRRRGTRFVLLDAALFFEFDLGLEVDAVLAVTAPRRVRRARLQARDGLTASQAEVRLRSQPRLAAWVRRADVRIDTDCPLRHLEPRLEEAWRELQRAARARRARGSKAI